MHYWIAGGIRDDVLRVSRGFCLAHLHTDSLAKNLLNRAKTTRWNTRENDDVTYIFLFNFLTWISWRHLPVYSPTFPPPWGSIAGPLILKRYKIKFMSCQTFPSIDYCTKISRDNFGHVAMPSSIQVNLCGIMLQLTPWNFAEWAQNSLNSATHKYLIDAR